MSHEIRYVAEAELVQVNEGNMCVVAKLDNATPPGSRAVSRTKGDLRDWRDPAGSVGEVSDRGVWQGRTGAAHRAEAGSRTDPYYL